VDETRVWCAVCFQSAAGWQDPRKHYSRFTPVFQAVARGIVHERDRQSLKRTLFWTHKHSD